MRKGILRGEREFFYEAGTRVEPFIAYLPPGTKTCFLVEGETDAMRLYQEFSDNGVTDAGVVGLPGVQAWRPEWANLFVNCERVFVVLDNDADYNVKAQVDGAWQRIRTDLRTPDRRVSRVKLDAAHVKDLCEYFKQGYDLDMLRRLVTESRSRYKPLDLSNASTPRPVNWLVEGLIGQGDLVLAFGEPGVGKSWLSMSLALAVAQGRQTWLGLQLAHQGKVLYIDEENPEDVILERFYKLGLRDEDAANLRVLHEQGVRMDRDPDDLLEEALEYEPVLIVVDSMTRVHTGNENDAGFIAGLFNDGFKPLARKTGATVWVQHHARKPSDSSSSSYARVRGSGDITASSDTGLDIRQVAPGHMQVIHARSRRRLPGPPINVRIMDTDEGKVNLVTNLEMPPPF